MPHNENTPQANKETAKMTSTPTLVRRYRDLHITGTRRRLTDNEHFELGIIVTELHARGVLD